MNDSIIRLSIIIPVYNNKAFLRRCIESVICQSVKEYEIILVDDGSTDGSSDICDEYDKLYSVVSSVHKVNEGPVSARMRGVKESKGDFITFLDSDDWVDNDLYEKLILPMIADNTLDISISAYTRFSDDGNSICYFERSPEQVFEVKDALFEMFQRKIFDWSGCGKVYKRSIISNICDNWWVESSYGEDIEWNWKAFNNANKIHWSGLTGYHYYENPNSLMHREWSKDFLAMADRFAIICNETSENEEAISDIVFKRLVVFCSCYVIEKIRAGEEYKCKDEIEKCRRYINIKNCMNNEYLTDDDKQLVQAALMSPEDYMRTIRKREEELCEAVYEIYDRELKIYIYGAGKVGGRISECLIRNGMDYDGFVTTRQTKSDNLVLQGKPVYIIDEIIKKNHNSFFLIAGNANNESQMETELQQRGVSKYKKVGQYVTGVFHR